MLAVRRPTRLVIQVVMAALTVSCGGGGGSGSSPVPPVSSAPTITGQPQPQAVPTGSTATFTVTATGTGLSYQWLRDGVAIPGATASTYTTPSLTVLDYGSQYSATINGASETSAISQAATLRVQGIEFVAGNTDGGGSADGTGASAGFTQVTGIVTDRAGDSYVADPQNATVRKITSGGVVTTVAGSAGLLGSRDGVGAAARFNNPTAVAMDASGNLYVADTDNDTIRRIARDGTVTTLAGIAGSPGTDDGTGTAARFDHPQGIAVAPNGLIYVADTGNNLIRTVDGAGAVTTIAGQPSFGRPGLGGYVDGVGRAAAFSHPVGLAIDSAGTVYVADSDNNVLRTIGPGAQVSTFAGSTSGTAGSADGARSNATFYAPSGIALDAAGGLYVADTNNATVRAIVGGNVTTLAGTARRFGSLDGTGAAARFRGPTSVGVDAAGNVYVTDSSNVAVRKIDASARVTTLAGTPPVRGSADGTGTAAGFFAPEGIAVDAAGNAFVADSGNDTIRKITPNGIATTFAGTPSVGGTSNGAGPAASFLSLSGVAIDGGGTLYVTDLQAVRKITSTGIVTTLRAGSPPDEALAVAVDPSGNAYLTDFALHVILKVTPSGTMSVLAGGTGEAGSTDGIGSAARFNGPLGIAIDATGNLYVADTGNQTIRKVTPAGVVSTLAGTAGVFGRADGTGASASFSVLNGVAVDASGNVYATDHATIRRITPAGVVTTVAGTPGVAGWAGSGTLPGLLRFARCVAVSPRGYLWVTMANGVARVGP